MPYDEPAVEKLYVMFVIAFRRELLAGHCHTYLFPARRERRWRVGDMARASRFTGRTRHEGGNMT